MLVPLYGNIILFVVLVAAVIVPAILVRRGSTTGKPYSGVALTSLICGIAGSLGTLIAFWGIATPAADILAIIFGAIGIHRANRLQLRGKAAAIWGLVLGIIGFISVIVLGIILFILALNQFGF